MNRKSSNYRCLSDCFNKRGVSLIELLLVTALSAIILSLLAVALRFIMQSGEIVDNTVVRGSRISLMQTQFDRDFSGLLPHINTASSQPAPTTQKKEKEEKNNNAQTDTKAATKETPEQQKESEQQKETAQLIFYASSSGNNFEMMSFVTNNSLAAAVAGEVGKPLPRVVRVIYRLVPDVYHPQSYLLMREERNDLGKSFLETEKETSASSTYELIDGIAHCSMTYGFIIEQEQKEAEQKTEKQAQKKINTTSVWQPGKKEKLPPFPHFIKIDIAVWDRSYRKQQTFVLYFEQPLSLERKQQPEAQKQPSTPSKVPPKPNNRPPGPVPPKPGGK